jgi:putative ABC transport system substrate-binding protein
MMQRRDLIILLGGTAAAAWSQAARAQQASDVRRIGVLVGGTESDSGWPANWAALREGLAKLGWFEGRNLRIDLRFAAVDLTRMRAHAAELVSLTPDVIVTNTGAATRMARQQTKTIPIVFTTAGDPVANDLMQSIARPEGNVTGFSVAEPSIASKYLEFLKEAAPRVARVAIIFNPELAATGPSYISSIEAAAPALAVLTIKTPIRNSVDIVRAIDAFAAEPNGGLLVLPPNTHPDTILQLAAQHRLPVIYANRNDVVAGGLMAYDTDAIDRHRRAASYIDRLLRGAKVSELPVQFPTKFQLIINLKAAKAIGLTIPEAFLLRADELIE